MSYGPQKADTEPYVMVKHCICDISAENHNTSQTLHHQMIYNMRGFSPIVDFSLMEFNPRQLFEIYSITSRYLIWKCSIDIHEQETYFVDPQDV